MIQRKYLLSLIALYGLINTINSANGKLMKISLEKSYDTVRFAIFECFLDRDHRCLLCPTKENGLIRRP